MTNGPQAASSDQPLTGWERPTGTEQPTGYATDVGYTVQAPPAVPYQEVEPPNRRRLAWIVGASAAGAAFVIAIVALLIIVPDRSGPAGEFNEASKTFHAGFDPLQQRLLSDIQAASSGFMDPSLTPVKTDAEAIQDLLEKYGNAVQAIVMPDTAADAKERFLRVTQAARLMMTAVAASLSKSLTQALLDGTWPSVVAELKQAETALRAALK